MANPLDLLLPRVTPPGEAYRWGVVTSTDPMRVQLDGETTPLGLTPRCLVDPMMLSIGDRVMVLIRRRRAVILGAGRFAPDIERGTMKSIATVDPDQSWANDGSYARWGPFLTFSVGVHMDTPTSGNSFGNIGNTTVFTFHPGYRPIDPTPAATYGGGQMVSYYVDPSGDCVAAATVPNNDLSGNISVSGLMLLDRRGY